MVTRPQVRGKSYRRLGRGQYPTIPALTAVATPSGSTVSLEFVRPIVVNGPVSLTVESRTFVSQVLSSPTTLVVTMSGTVAGFDYELPANDPHIRGSHGEGNADIAGTFP